MVTARSICTPIDGDTFAGDVAHDDLIDVIADRVEASELPFKVVEDGVAIGQITSKSVVDILVGRY